MFLKLSKKSRKERNAHHKPKNEIGNEIKEFDNEFASVETAGSGNGGK